ncbi:hypothetical protein [Streptomyces sp. WM6378]|uniref:hypothetical protein n=1 Tax=Streptomyces sp. WM6378 TaxID=1415557 RepID=UPI003B634412
MGKIAHHVLAVPLDLPHRMQLVLSVAEPEIDGDRTPRVHRGVPYLLQLDREVRVLSRAGMPAAQHQVDRGIGVRQVDLDLHLHFVEAAVQQSPDHHRNAVVPRGDIALIGRPARGVEMRLDQLLGERKMRRSGPGNDELAELGRGQLQKHEGSPGTR